MPGKLLILTGASGSGKTTILNLVKSQLKNSSLVFLHFDSAGVPSFADMERQFGSPEGWQKFQTIEWAKQIGTKYLPLSDVIFEGQMRIQFIEEALQKANILQARIVLVDCDDKVRMQRLTHDRQQPELANENMMNWASFLRNEARNKGIEILDTSALSVEQGASRILAEFLI